MIRPISDKIVKIRKKHRCFACSRVFEKDTMMNRQTNIYEGDGIYSIYSCLACTSIMKEFPETTLDPYDDCFPEECVLCIMDDLKASPEQILEYFRVKGAASHSII